jgi:hypothetical protein
MSRSTTMARLAAAARTLVLDRLTAAAADTLDAAGIPFLLLKGPAVADAFYDATEFRGYQDVDLLVPADRYADAVHRLVEAGWHRPQEHWSLEELAISGENLIFRAPEGPVQLDLHHSFHGVRRPEAAWSVLAADPRRLQVGERSVPAPSLPVQGLLAALHASTGTAGSHSHEDLRRAVQRLPVEDWQAAVGMARRLGAEGAVAEALRLVIPDSPLLRRLDLTEAEDIEVQARQSTVGPYAYTWYRIRAVGSLRGRLAMLLLKIFPTPAFARMQTLMAGEKLPLPLWYLRRWLRLARVAVPVLQEARRLARRRRPDTDGSG